MKYFFLFIILLSFRFGFSQAPYEEGYVITTKGDTLKGKIKDRKYVENPANCDKIYFIDSKGVETSKTPYDIKQYCRKGTVFFYVLPIGYESKLKFAQVIETGNVVLYGYSSNSLASNANELLSKSDSKKAGKSNVEYFLQRKKDPNSLMKIRPKDFESTSTFYFQDNEDLVKKIEDKTYKLENVIELVKAYNAGKK